MTALVLALGLVCWITTTIVVESELFRPLRDVVDRRKRAAGRVLDNTTHYPHLTRDRARRRRRLVRREVFWRKAAYLVSCHLCAGTWIGLALAAAVPGVRPFGTGLVGWALAGLLVKAVAHLTLVVQHLGEAATR